MYDLGPRKIHVRFNGPVDDGPVDEFVKSVQAHVARAASSPADYPDGLIALGMVIPFGGHINAAFRAHERLAHLQDRLITCNESLIQSAGNILFSLGAYRCMRPGAQFRFHAIHVKWTVANTTRHFVGAQLQEFLVQLEAGTMPEDDHAFLREATQTKTDDELQQRLSHELDALLENERDYFEIMKNRMGVPDSVLAPYMQAIEHKQAGTDLLDYLVNTKFSVEY